MPPRQTKLISQCQDDEPWTTYEVFILWHATVASLAHVIVLENAGLQGTTCITKSSPSLTHGVHNPWRLQALAESTCGFLPTAGFRGLLENLPALMLKTLKLLMISLFRSHHCLNSSSVVCEEHLLPPEHTSRPAGGCTQHRRCEESKLWVFGECCCWWLSDYQSRAGNGVRRCFQLGCGDLLGDHSHASAFSLLALCLSYLRRAFGALPLDVVIAAFSTAGTRSLLGTLMSPQSKYKMTNKTNFFPIIWERRGFSGADYIANDRLGR